MAYWQTVLSIDFHRMAEQDSTSLPDLPEQSHHPLHIFSLSKRVYEHRSTTSCSFNLQHRVFYTIIRPRMKDLSHLCEAFQY